VDRTDSSGGDRRSVLSEVIVDDVRVASGERRDRFVVRSFQDDLCGRPWLDGDWVSAVRE